MEKFFLLFMPVFYLPGLFLYVKHVYLIYFVQQSVAKFHTILTNANLPSNKNFDFVRVLCTIMSASLSKSIYGHHVIK